jgi:hypothetical protein
MIARGLGVALIARALLLPEQLLEARALLGGEDLAELLAGAFQLIGQQGPDRLHDLASVFLAFTQDAVNPFVLFRGQVEFLLHPAEQFQLKSAW